jgi:hypothetical protein
VAARDDSAASVVAVAVDESVAVVADCAGSLDSAGGSADNCDAVPADSGESVSVVAVVVDADDWVAVD